MKELLYLKDDQLKDLIDLIKKRTNIYSKALYEIKCDNLTKNEIVDKIKEIYESKIEALEAKIEKLEGWGKLSASNLRFSIENSKIISLDKLIYSLGIRHIGQENAKLLADNIQSVEKLSKINNSFNFESRCRSYVA